jgi:nitrogen PTS system EIIA component
MQLSVRDAANLLSVPEKTIYRWIRQELIPARRINDEFRLNRAELLEWATSRMIEISPEVIPEETPSLSEALNSGGIAYQVGGTDEASVLRAVVDILKLPADVDREFLFDVLLARQSLGSTGIGDGIAIPHVRNPVVLQVSEPTVTLCFLAHEIDFRAIDGRPVGILFTMICPTIRVHLHLLSRLGFVLQNREFRGELLRRASPDDLVAALSRAEAVIPAANHPKRGDPPQ